MLHLAVHQVALIDAVALIRLKETPVSRKELKDCLLVLELPPITVISVVPEGEGASSGKGHGLPLFSVLILLGQQPLLPRTLTILGIEVGRTSLSIRQVRPLLLSDSHDAHCANPMDRRRCSSLTSY